MIEEMLVLDVVTSHLLLSLSKSLGRAELGVLKSGSWQPFLCQQLHVCEINSSQA